jgi:D-alanyl-D-alanine carboxypeptidase
MSSGFPSYPEAKLLAGVSADLHQTWTAQDVLALVDPTGPRDGTLGGPAKYNSINYVLLGGLVEKVTGRPLAQALRADLIEPAGLSRVWTQTGESPQPPLTVAVQESSRALVDPAGPYLPSRSWATAVAGGGTIAADAPSLARWGYLLYGGHVIDSSLVAQMTKGSTGEWNYGLGTMTAEIDGRHVVGHAGDMNVYTSLMLVWGGGNPATVSVLVPAPQVGDDLKPELAVTLQQIVQSAGTA